MTGAAATLDHVVVNTLRGMDATAQLFAALGFTLTPLGRHSLGSINHLMMTPGPYLELVGVPESGLQRQEVLDSPFGLNGLVLRSDDAEATRDRLLQAGLFANPVSTFSRPVTIEGAEQQARFRTVRLAPDFTAAGRVYFCEHLTRHYVWRPEWLTHPNTFSDIAEMVVSATDPGAEARRYALACGATAADDGDAAHVRLGPFTIRFVRGPEPRFRSLGLRFQTLDVLRQRASVLPDLTWHETAAGAATLTLPTLGLQLECRGVR